MNIQNFLLQIAETAGRESSEGNIWMDMVKMSPLIAVLIGVIFYLVKKGDKKEKEVEELNLYVRENDKENLVVLTELSKSLEKIIDNQRASGEAVSKQIQNLKEFCDQVVVLDAGSTDGTQDFETFSLTEERGDGTVFRRDVVVDNPTWWEEVRVEYVPVSHSKAAHKRKYTKRTKYSHARRSRAAKRAWETRRANNNW